MPFGTVYRFIDRLSKGMLYLLSIMPRMSRAVVVGVPHHVIQRGNRRQKTFFSEGDYEVYKDLMAQWCAKRGVEV